MKENSNILFLDLFSGNGRLSDENKAIVKKEFSKYIGESAVDFLNARPFRSELKGTRSLYLTTKKAVKKNQAIKEAIEQFRNGHFPDYKSFADFLNQILNELNEKEELINVLLDCSDILLSAPGRKLSDWIMFVLKAIYALIKALPELKEKIEQWRKYREVKRAYKKLQKKGLPNLGTNDPLQDGNNPNLGN